MGHSDPLSAAFWWALQEALGGREEYGRTLLSVLAFGEGAGMPVHVWRAAAAVVLQQDVSYADIGWVMKAAASFLVEDLTPDERSAYRLYHEALSERLREAAKPGTQRCIALALMGLAGCSGVESRLDWGNSDCYVRDHLATHAAAGGLLEQLAADPAFLKAAERGRLLRALEHAPAVRDQALVFLQQ
jgi:hypothetical protein